MTIRYNGTYYSELLYTAKANYFYFDSWDRGGGSSGIIITRDRRGVSSGIIIFAPSKEDSDTSLKDEVDTSVKINLCGPRALKSSTFH